MYTGETAPYMYNQQQLLDKYLSGTCTHTELQAVKQMLGEPGTEELLHQLMMQRTDLYETAIPDEALSGKVKQWEEKVMRQVELSMPPKRLRTARRVKMLRYAAVTTGILLSGYLSFLVVRQPASAAIAMVEQVNPTDYPVQYKLPDNSTVYLGAGSSIRYQEQFKTSREVSLRGEAFFDVQPDPHKPFIVQSRSMQTSVLGTSFKLDAKDNVPLLISVASGKVSVSAVLNGKEKPLAVLGAGEKLRFNETAHSYQHGNTDINSLLQWTEGDLVFDEHPLGLVMQELETRYHVSITFRDRTKADYRISGSFEKDQDLHSVLTMLSAIGKFRYSFHDKQTIQISN